MSHDCHDDIGSESCLLVSSASRSWSGLSAQLRSHGHGVTAWPSPGQGIEVCISIKGSRSVISREWNGMTDRTVARTGTIWVAPPVREGFSIELSEPVPEILHLMLPPHHFSTRDAGDAAEIRGTPALHYEQSLQDPLLAEMGFAIAKELRDETSVGAILVESLASSFAARLMQEHGAVKATNVPPARKGLDQRRLTRILSYIDVNLEGDLTINQLSSVANLSPHHFARAFKTAVGQAPHGYISAKRLSRAKVLLAQGDHTLVDIALTLSFSCQANFTRAFRRMTGLTPGQYRRVHS